MSTRSFNVFSERIVVWPGESFRFVVNPNEIGSGEGVDVTISGVSLTPAGPYNVTPTGPVTVTAPAAAAQGTISCNPADPGVATQNIVVATLKADVCDDVQIDPGDYFIWENKQESPVLITAATGNENFWPLPDEEHEVPANGWLPLQIPTDATVNDEENPACELRLIVNGKDFICNPRGTQPKLIVGSEM
jgi:hypothetical protein